MCLESVGVWLPFGFIRPDHPTLDVLRVCCGFEVGGAHARRVVTDHVVYVVPIGNRSIFPQVCLLMGSDMHPIDPKVSVAPLKFRARPLPTIVRFIDVFPESDLGVLSRSAHETMVPDRNWGLGGKFPYRSALAVTCNSYQTT